MNEELLSIITACVTIILGLIAKKYKWINTKFIPLQNLAVGIIVAIVEFIITKDFDVAVSVSGLIAGGTYDIIHNIDKLIKGE